MGGKVSPEKVELESKRGVNVCIMTAFENGQNLTHSFKVLSLGEDVLPNYYIMDKKVDQENRWIILHYSPFKVNKTDVHECDLIIVYFRLYGTGLY